MTNAELALLKDFLSCHEDMIARLRGYGGLVEWLSGVESTANALRSAIVTIEALPVTADGVRVVPGMTVYLHLADKTCVVESITKEYPIINYTHVEEGWGVVKSTMSARGEWSSRESYEASRNPKKVSHES